MRGAGALAVLAASTECPALGSLDRALTVRASLRAADLSAAGLDWDADPPLVSFPGVTTKFGQAQCFAFKPDEEVWSARATPGVCRRGLGVAEFVPAGQECALAAIDLIRAENTIEVRLRLDNCQAGDGIVVTVERGGRGAPFHGLHRWMCAVMRERCLATAMKKESEVQSGSTTIVMTTSLKPIVNEDGHSGMCVPTTGDAEVKPAPNTSTVTACKVACIGRSEVATSTVTLARKKHCIGYAFNEQKSECLLFLKAHDATANPSQSSLKVTKGDADWSCVAVEPSSADLSDVAPSVQAAQTVYDDQAPLNLPTSLLPEMVHHASAIGVGALGQPANVALRAVAQRLSMPAMAKYPDCLPSSTWFVLQDVMSISEDEWSKLEGLVPSVPARPVVPSSLTLGKACVCFTSSCLPCADPCSSWTNYLFPSIAACLLGLLLYLAVLYCRRPPIVKARPPRQITGIITRDAETGQEVRQMLGLDHPLPATLMDTANAAGPYAKVPEGPTQSADPYWSFSATPENAAYSRPAPPHVT